MKESEDAAFDNNLEPRNKDQEDGKRGEDAVVKDSPLRLLVL